MTVVMWEVRTSADRVDHLLAWVRANAAPEAEIYRSADDPPRVVVLDPSGVGLPETPREFVARSPHTWTFERVDRN